MAILLFFCILLSILSIRMLIEETLQQVKTDWLQYIIYIPTCILWSIFYYLS